MDYMRSKMICQVCPDKRRAKLAIDDTKRITNSLRRFISSSRLKNKKNISIFLCNPIHCQYTANLCSNFQLLSHELQVAEQELKGVFDQLCFHIGNLLDSDDKVGAARITHHAKQLLRGHYPQAIRYLSRGDFC